MITNRISPFVKRMRTNGGTIYTFSSAVEDIGLNINERNNVVKLSHFALLDIPSINDDTSIVTNNFNVQSISGAWEYEQSNASIKDGRVLIAESFQNYALNLESTLLAQPNYDPTLIRTVTERVFWKWLKETGAIRFSKDVSTIQKQYWSEEIDADGSLGYNSVVKYIGQVSAGNVRTDSFGTYNETYILVPTSHGQTDAYFEIIEDSNYRHGMDIGGLSENILGRENYTLPHPDGLSFRAYYDFMDSSTQSGTTPWLTYYDNSTGGYIPGWWYTAEGREPIYPDNTYFTDSSAYLTSGIYNTNLKYQNGGNTIEFKRSNIDCLSLIFDINELKDVYDDTSMTYDRMAIQHSVNDSFNFNAVLIYYTVYNSTQDQVLGRNLLGVLFIDAPSGNTQDIGFGGIVIPSLEKIQSGPSGFGTSYSLRLNIKTDNMVDDTAATIIDLATSDQLWADDWTEAFANLNSAVNILTQNNSVINHISTQYSDIQSTHTQILNDFETLQWQVNDIGRDIAGTPNVIPMFTNGDDPIIDSSIYMRFGNVGIQTAEPLYPLHVVGTTKTDDIIIQNAIRDISNNVILGYGSPLQLGASTNSREINIYTGNLQSAIHIDTSNNINFRGDVSIVHDLNVDGSSFLKDIYADNIFSKTFDFKKSYIKDNSIGSQFSWESGYLTIIASSDVSASGNTGDIQVNSGGALLSDSSFYWDFTNHRLGICTRDPSVEFHIIGNAKIDGSINITGNVNIEKNLKVLGNIASPGSNTQILYNNSGNITANPSITWNNNILSIDGSISLTKGITSVGGITSSGLVNINNNIILGNTVSRSIYIATGGSPQVLTIHSNDQISDTAAGGSLILRAGDSYNIKGATTYLLGGSSYFNTGGDVDIRGGLVSGGGLATGGNVNIDGGSALGSGGHVSIYGGNSTGTGNGGDVSINAGGYNVGRPGYIYIGNTPLDTSAIYLGNNITLPVGIAKPYQMLYADSADGYKLKRGYNGRIDYTNNSLDISANIGNVTEVSTGLFIMNNSGNSNAFANIDFATATGFSNTYSSARIAFRGSNNTNINDTTNYIGFFLYNGSTSLNHTEKFRMARSGNFHADGDIIAYSTMITSDERLKNNIYTLEEDSLYKINQLRPVTFNWKDENRSDRSSGFIAQEFEKIFPSLVSKNIKLNDSNEEEYLHIRYNELIPHMINAMKQQQDMINDLKKEINQLKNKI